MVTSYLLRLVLYFAIFLSSSTVSQAISLMVCTIIILILPIRSQTYRGNTIIRNVECCIVKCFGYNLSRCRMYFLFRANASSDIKFKLCIKNF